jgi:hypothetical protein
MAETSPDMAAGSETVLDATVGGSLGGGVDIRAGRSWTAGMAASYRFSGEVKTMGAWASRYTGWELTFAVGKLFGSNKPADR